MKTRAPKQAKQPAKDEAKAFAAAPENGLGTEATRGDAGVGSYLTLADLGDAFHEPKALAMGLEDVKTVAVQRDPFDTGRYDEDGGKMILERMTIVGETEDGARWQHARAFGSEENFAGAVAEADAFCVKIQAHLDTGGKLKPELWSEQPAAYGSRAYEALGEEAKTLAWEKEQG